MLTSIRCQENTRPALQTAVLILRTYKDSLCLGEQCVMIYEIKHHQFANSKHSRSHFYFLQLLVKTKKLMYFETGFVSELGCKCACL